MKNVLKRKIDEIAQCIFAEINRNDIKNAGLYYGSFGYVIFVLYYYNSFNVKKSNSKIENYVSKLLNEHLVNEANMTYGDGLAGELYLFDFLRSHNIIDLDIGNAQHIFEQYMLIEMRRSIQNKYYDFMHGALGFGLFFLKNKSNEKHIYELVDFLYNIADKNDTNTIYKWESNLIYNENVMGYNLSMSHGMSSIIIFLVRVIKSGISNEKILTMLTGAVNYILSQELNFVEYGFSFPNYIYKNPTDTISKSRLAWCYGDLGVGLALWQAGSVTANSEWKDKSLEIFLKSVYRQETDNVTVKDPGLCHGSAGIAMIFRRMYILTKHDEFDKASLYWLNRTLELSYFKDGLAGYKSLLINKWVCDHSLLTGISGIGLLLLSFFNNDLQEWDELFLLS